MLHINVWSIIKLNVLKINNNVTALQTLLNAKEIINVSQLINNICVNP